MYNPKPRHCTMAASGESPPKKRAKRGASALPSGITVRGKKYQARLNHVPTGGTRTEQRSVGMFETVDQAVAALAEAPRRRWRAERNGAYSAQTDGASTVDVRALRRRLCFRGSSTGFYARMPPQIFC